MSPHADRIAKTWTLKEVSLGEKNISLTVSSTKQKAGQNF
ncbi:hypothetical protein M23134_05256 [Microscilla marina ATCC 23134]|uniref:Uncharacterized protein n=1 Tax=Microscilla marina ATCC 23134 TaxID=313606 RepID=A1ZDL1_MICM2|nr:hypothetical protein M23134_05256 [Microscilla marina ATCC 23134]